MPGPALAEADRTVEQAEAALGRREPSYDWVRQLMESSSSPGHSGPREGAAVLDRARAGAGNEAKARQIHDRARGLLAEGRGASRETSSRRPSSSRPGRPGSCRTSRTSPDH